MLHPAHRSAWRDGLCLLLLWAALCGQASMARSDSAGGAAPLETRLRAAFLFNFARFTQWPNAGAGTGFDFCVVSDESIHRVLEQTLAGKELAGRTPRVRSLRQPEQGRDCELLYLPRMPAAERQAWLDSVGEAPVLTVGEGREFTRRGGMIAFHLAEQRLRFAINPQAVRANGMQMSSRLLGLADIEGGDR